MNNDVIFFNVESNKFRISGQKDFGITSDGSLRPKNFAYYQVPDLKMSSQRGNDISTFRGRTIADIYGGEDVVSLYVIDNDNNLRFVGYLDCIYLDMNILKQVANKRTFIRKIKVPEQTPKFIWIKEHYSYHPDGSKFETPWNESQRCAPDDWDEVKWYQYFNSPHIRLEWLSEDNDFKR